MWQDLRFGFRTLSKNPGFAAVAVTALALGIGADATVFSLANAILFKNLPFEGSGDVRYLVAVNPRHQNDINGLSHADFYDLRSQLKSFTGLGGAWSGRMSLSDDVNLAESYQGAHMSANGFSVLGQHPAAGRLFLPDDEKPGAEPVVVLGYGLWETRFGKDPSLIGRKIRVDSVPTTVIGVAPRDFTLPLETRLWLPDIPDPKEARGAGPRLDVFGKLAPGVTREAAQSELAVVAQRLAAEYPLSNKDVLFQTREFQQIAISGGQVRTVFTVLLGAVGFVLLIACANVANLLLSRAVGRAREISIRAALGAGRWRVVRQLLAESLLLSIAGGLIGWAIALVGIRAFDAAVIPTGKPSWIDFSMDYRALGYLAVITLSTAVLFGLAPALRLSRMDVNTALKEGGRAGGSIRGRYLSGGLVAAEMALAVVLLTGAGLMIRSFLNAYSHSVGVDTANILTLRLDLPHARYSTPAEQLEFQRRLTERLRAIAGVENAAVASSILGASFGSDYEAEGRPADPKHLPSTDFVLAGDGYFETLRLAAPQGRVLRPADYISGPNVAVVNQELASRAWPHRNPIGQRFRLVDDGKPGEWTAVVGVIPNVLQPAGRAETAPIAIFPYRQSPHSWMQVLVRARVDAAALANPVRREIQSIDHDLPVRDVMTFDERLALSRWPWRVFGAMFAIFAGIALLLATVGLYAVVAYGVNQRTREIGLRVALGAPSGSILGMIVRQGMRPAALGLLLGLTAAFGITRVLKSLLVDIKPTDPLTFGIVAGVLLAASVLGCLVPARRAIRVDPAIALRDE